MLLSVVALGNLVPERGCEKEEPTVYRRFGEWNQVAGRELRIPRTPVSARSLMQSAAVPVPYLSSASGALLCFCQS